MMGFNNDEGELICLKIKGVLHVPHLSRRLFSLMTLYEQDHTICMNRQYGVRI